MLTVADFVAGWIGGFAGLMGGHPFDTIKVRQQNFNTGLFVSIGRTFRYEGVRGFYKGMLFPLLTTGPANAVFFGVYGNTLRFLQTNEEKHRIITNDPHWLHHVFIAGSWAGFLQVMLFCPVEVVKTILQASTSTQGNWNNRSAIRYTGMTDCIKHVYRAGGLSGLYRGLVPMLHRDVWSSGIYTLTYEYFLQYPPIVANAVTHQIVAGASAGVTSWIVVLPFDVIKSRMQADDVTNPMYKGMMDCFQKSLRAEGTKIFGQGFVIIICRAMIVNAAIFLGYEQTMTFFRDVNMID